MNTAPCPICKGTGTYTYGQEDPDKFIKCPSCKGKGTVPFVAGCPTQPDSPFLKRLQRDGIEDLT